MTDPAGSPDVGFWRTRRWWVMAGRASAGVYVATGLSFLATLVAARTLAPSGFGALELAVVAVGGVATFLDFSLEEAVVHHGARALAVGDVAGLRGLVRMSAGIDVAIGAGVAAVLFAFASSVGDLVSSGSLPPNLVRLAAVEVLVVTANGTTGAVLVVGGRAHLRAWSSAVASGARLAGVAVAASVDAGPVGVLAGLVAGSALGSVAQLAWSRRTGDRLWGTTPPARSHVPAGDIVRFGFHSSATTTLIALRVALVSVVLGRTLGPEAVAVFAVAMFPVALVDVASSPLRLLMIPEQASLAARGRRDVIWEGLVAYGRAAAIVGLIGAAVGWFALPGVLPFLYGSAYDAAIDPARALVLAGFAALVTAWAKALPAAIGRPAVRTAMSTAELAVTVGAVLLVYEHGVTPVAWAVSAVAAAASVAWWALARRILQRT